MKKKNPIRLSIEEMKTITAQSWNSMTCANGKKLECPAGYTASGTVPPGAFDNSKELQGIVCIKKDSETSGSADIKIYCDSSDGQQNDRTACHRKSENDKCSWNTGNQTLSGTCQFNSDRELYCKVGSGTSDNGDSGSTYYS